MSTKVGLAHSDHNLHSLKAYSLDCPLGLTCGYNKLYLDVRLYVDRGDLCQDPSGLLVR